MQVWIVTTWISYEGGEPLGACDSEEAAIRMIASDMGEETFKSAKQDRFPDGEVSYTDPKCEAFGYSYVKAEMNKALR